MAGLDKEVHRTSVAKIVPVFPREHPPYDLQVVRVRVSSGVIAAMVP
jgi:hypothetical protein